MKEPGQRQGPAKSAKNRQTGVSTAQAVEPKPAASQLTKPLTVEEKQHLSTLEKVIDAKPSDFFDVGSALMEIKGDDLFRETHRNFNLYCQDRWGFGRSYANKLIGSAERIQLLPRGQVRPANEFQIRPFLKLGAAEFPQKWQTVVESAGARKVTSRIVEDTLNLRKKKRGRPKGSSSGQKKGVAELLASLRATLMEGNMEESLKELGKLERLFKG